MFASSSGSWPSKSITIIAALTASSGHFSSINSKPLRVSSSGGNASLEAIEKSACKKGRPAPSRIINVGINTAQGRFITKLAILAHAPSSLTLSVSNEYFILFGTFICLPFKGNLKLNNKSLSNLLPSKLRIAGKTTIENTIAILTASVPPIPRLGRPVFSKNSMPIRPIATVIPEKNTALPAVATVIATEVRMSLPLFISSLNLYTINSE